MNRLVARSLEILGKTAKSIGEDYTSNLTSLITDAKEVKNSLVKTGTDASDTFVRLKNANITKKISDWFYEEESKNESGSDEFDPGFKVESSDEAHLDGESKPRALDADSMTDITEKQTSTMLKIGRRQTEQSVANTAEIISTFNSRSSEMIASMNNINKTLIGISDRMDKLIQLNSVETGEEREKEINKNGLFVDGKLSLPGIFEAAKSGVTNNTVVQTAQMVLSMFQEGMTPDMALKELLGNTVLKKPMINVGGEKKSINDIGKGFNEFIGTIAQTSMTEFIKNGPLKGLFSGLIDNNNPDMDYGRLVVNTYDTKRAQFDGMTRWSIISVIPEYLNKINESLSGKSYHVDSKGKLVEGSRKNEFANVVDNTFASSGISDKAFNKITTSAKKVSGLEEISSQDINTAGEALTAAIVVSMHSRGTTVFAQSDLKKDTSEYIEMATMALCRVKNDPAYWAKVCQLIIIQISSGLMDGAKFVQNINQSLQNTVNEATAFAQSGKTNSYQASRITFDMVMDRFEKKHSNGSSTTSQPQQSTVTETNTIDNRNAGVDGNIQRIEPDDAKRGKYSSDQYLRGIFGILNRGINVKVLDDPTKEGFGDYDLDRESVKQIKDDGKFGQIAMGLIADGGSKGDNGFIKDIIKEATASTIAAVSGQQSSESSQGGTVKGGGGFLSNILGMAAGSALGSIARESIGPSLGKTLKSFFGKVETDEEGNVTAGEGRKIANDIKDKAVEKTKDTATPIIEAAKHDKRIKGIGTAILGEKVTDAEGNVKRENGIVQGIRDRVVDASGKVKEAIEGNKTFQKAKESTHRVINNLAYDNDSRIMKSAKEGLENFDVDSVDNEASRLIIEEYVLAAVKQGDYETAKEELENLPDGETKNVLGRYIDKIINITKKRSKGESDKAKNEIDGIDPETVAAVDRTYVSMIKSYIEEGDYVSALGLVEDLEDGPIKDKLKKNLEILANNNEQGTTIVGGTPDIGAVLENAPEKPSGEYGEKSVIQKIFNVVKKGFSGVAKVLKKIGKTLLKIADDGILNLTTGLKTMAEGFFGSKRRDKDGNVLTDENGKALRQKGLIEQLAIDPVKGVLKGSKKLATSAVDAAKSTVTKIGDMQISHKSDKTVREGWNDFKDKTKEKTQEFMTKAGEMKITKGSDETVANLLKSPVETLKKTFNDVSESINNSKLGQRVKELSDKFADSGLGKFLGTVKSKISGGNGLIGRTLQGATSGFKKVKEIKAKRDEEKAKKSEAAERGSSFINRTVGSIMDIFKGTDKSPSLLTNIYDVITGIHKDVNKNHEDDVKAQEEDKKKQEAEKEKEKNSKSNSGSSDSKSDKDSKSKNIKKESSSVETDTGGDSGDSGKKGGGIEKVLGSIGDLGNNIGKIFGGFTQAVLGIGELIVSAVMSLEGIQALMDMLKSIVTDGIEPLNGIFEAIMDSIKPTVDALKTIIGSVAETLVTIVESLINVIQPILDVVTSILDEVLDVLNPIFEVITVILDVVLAPFMIAINYLLPIIEGIGYELKVVSGIVQFGMGMIITMLGGILTGVGAIYDFFGGDDSLTKQGKAMVTQGKDMISAGMTSVKEGFIGMKDSALKMIPIIGNELAGDNDDDGKGKVNTDDVNIDGGPMGSGDTDNRVITNNTWTYNNTYGSGNTTMNQHSYGNYMNMSERGCGPVALADAYSRRTGNAINPMALASKMAGSGAYEPNRGTSVGSFIRTSNALGMGMQVGGVTQSSLKRATPNNPITLLGSGSDFGTRSGNDHYVNVIGTDKHGGAYVANPMTGRVERRSASTLALNSRLGLYGSGDTGDDFYTFDDTTNEAMENLRKLTEKLTTMFTGDSSADKTQKKIDAGKDADKAKQIKLKLGDDFEGVEKEAFEAFKTDNPKRDGESDDEYNKRIEKLWAKEENYNKYIIKHGGQSAYDKTIEDYDSRFGSVESAGGALNQFADDMESLSVGSPSSGAILSNGETGYFVADNGARLAPFTPIKHYAPNIEGTRSSAAPLFDFFTATGGKQAFSEQGNWYGRRNDPDKTGRGKSGAEHGGLDVQWEGRSMGTPLYATTGGVIVDVRRGGYHGASSNNACGNNIKWRDSGGMYHWYMHMDDIDDSVQVGANMQPGQFVGHAGNTGGTGPEDGLDKGAHLHYTINDDQNKSSNEFGHVNPLTYFYTYDATGGMTGMAGSTNEEKIWSYFLSKNMPKVGIAGLMGNLFAESRLRPNNLQDSYEGPLGHTDESYTTAVDNGSYKNFTGDSAGYGLAQWTSSNRKANLLSAKNKAGSSISDLGTQLDFLMHELETSYSSVLNTLMSATDIRTASNAVLHKFEVPGDQSSTVESYRASEGQGYYDKFKDWVPDYGASSSSSSIFSADFDALKSEIGDNWELLGSGKVKTKDGDDLNFRDGPGGSIIGTIPNGTTIGAVYYAPGTQGWYPIIYQKQLGWVSKDYMDVTGWSSTVSGPKLPGESENKPKDTSGVYGPSLPSAPSSSSGSVDTKYIPSITPDMSDPSVYDPWASRDRLNQNFLEKLLLSPSSIGVMQKAGILTEYYKGDLEQFLDAVIEACGTKQAGTLIDISKASLEKKIDAFLEISGVTKSGNVINATMSQVEKNLNTFLASQITPIGEKIMKKLSGSGDISSNFWYDSIFANSNIQPDIPPIDESRLTNEYDDTNMAPFQTFVQKYVIKSDDSDRTEFLKKMGDMTFNVRAQRVEELLEELIDKIDSNRNGPKPTPSTSTTDTNLFKSNSIPPQVTRLSRG